MSVCKLQAFGAECGSSGTTMSSGGRLGSAASLLLYIEDPLAPGARVIGVFEALEKEWDQAAANHQPGRQNYSLD